MSPLFRDALEAGRIYRATGAIPSDMLRSDICRAWQRSHLQGANPQTLQLPQLSRLDTERLIDLNSGLINMVRHYLQILSQTVGTERHTVMLSNRDAIVLDVVADEKTLHKSQSLLVPGTLMSEAVAGANGIGTSLAEQKYVEIMATEHFIEGFHEFFCQGIPLRNHKEEIVGVLGISVHSGDTLQRLKEILLCTSQSIKTEFLIAILEKDIRRVLESNPEDYQPLEELRQDIIQAHQAARLKLEIVSRMAINRSDVAMQLLQQAEHSIQIFRRRAETWLNLASSEIGTPQSLSLTDAVSDLVDLLSTETAIRQVGVVMHWNKPITVVAEKKSLLRRLFRYFLQAFEIAHQGGTVEVEVDRIPNSKLAQISFKPIPVFKISQTNLIPYIFTIPIGKNLL
jgi:transcriptional regulator of acetoin/glycerol metabolism